MKKPKRKKGWKNKAVTVFLALGMLGGFLLWQNKGLCVSYYEISHKKLPSDFDGYVIVHISDLHSAVFGKNNDVLIKKIEQAKPDIIVVTGDIISSYDYKPDVAVDFISRASKLCDVYFVSGNHETRIKEYPELKVLLAQAGAVILENESILLRKGDSSVVLAGIDGGGFGLQATKEDDGTALFEDEEAFDILLAHKPQYFEDYRLMGAELIFSGHAHGGQIRLPFIGGIYAPGQGFFPKYTSGVYEEYGSLLVVSRGLGGSIVPFRIFNRPEIVVVTLKSV